MASRGTSDAGFGANSLLASRCIRSCKTYSGGACSNSSFPFWKHRTANAAARGGARGGESFTTFNAASS